MELQNELFSSFRFFLFAVSPFAIALFAWSKYLERHFPHASGRGWASIITATSIAFLVIYCGLSVSQSIDVNPVFELEHLAANCRISALGMVTTLGAGAASPDINTSNWTFAIDSEDMFKAAIGFTSDFHDTISGLIKLGAAVVALTFVMISKFIFESVKIDNTYISARAAFSTALVIGGIASLVSAQHLLFMIVNGQLDILFSGRAFCYQNFTALYSDLFLFVVVIGLSCVVAILILPECLRFHFQAKE